MNELLVLHRADFYAFCNALNNFPDWGKVQEWVADNEVTAGQVVMPDVEDTIRETAVGPAELSAKLDAILSAVQQLAVIGQVFEQFGSMMGPSEPPSMVGTHPGMAPGINFLGSHS